MIDEDRNKFENTFRTPTYRLQYSLSVYRPKEPVFPVTGCPANYLLHHRLNLIIVKEANTKYVDTKLLGNRRKHTVLSSLLLFIPYYHNPLNVVPILTSNVNSYNFPRKT